MSDWQIGGARKQLSNLFIGRVGASRYKGFSSAFDTFKEGAAFGEVCIRFATYNPIG